MTFIICNIASSSVFKASNAASFNLPVTLLLYLFLYSSDSDIPVFLYYKDPVITFDLSG